MKLLHVRIRLKKADMHTLEQLRSGELKGIKHLKISQKLESFPTEILDLAETLEILDLSHNRLRSLPQEISQLKKLKIAFFSYNEFRELPDVFKSMAQLYMLGFKANRIEHFEEDILPLSISWLILTDNRIKTLPRSIGKLSKLRKCALAGNEIEALPKEIEGCKELELLRLSANRIKKLPDELLNLPKLAWLAYSGNPCTTVRTFAVKEESLDNIVLEEQLGEGASGEIYRGYSKRLKQEVAVKLFKGAVTSDGYAIDEINACIAAGEHPNLIKVISKLEGERPGLVLELISTAYVNLGYPPDFNTCTRDTFEKTAHFSAQSILSIAIQIASTAVHLHARGMMHGDLYAHNILINDKDDVYLGDFGATSFYDVGESIFEKIEVRAFGYLLDDLLSLCRDKETKMYSALAELSRQCLYESVELRPEFKAIEAHLIGMQGKDQIIE